MADDPQPTVKVSPDSAALLAGATAALGAVNTVVACFLLGDPFAVGSADLAPELVGIRDAGLAATTAVAEVAEREWEIDLDPIADAAAEMAGGVLSLACRWLEVARRRGELGPLAAGEVERMEDTLRALADLLPGAGRRRL